jgi:tubulin polyglutamylase TTLL4
LKIYVYEEGLVRFASEPYDSTGSNKFVFLTNYSINKKSEKFEPNMDPTKDDIGHKWSISALNRHFDSIGIDSSFIWAKIYDKLIKTIIAIED